MELLKKYWDLPLLWKVSAGLVLGVVIGLLWGEDAAVLEPLGTIFLRLLIMLALPIVFLMILRGILAIDPRSAGSIAWKILLYYFATSIVAVTLGLGLGLLVNPGAGLRPIEAEQVEEPESVDWVTFLLEIVPDNLFGGVVGTSPVTIVLVAVLLAIPLSVLTQRGNESVRRGAQQIVDVSTAVAEAMFLLIKAVLQYAPIGLAALIASGLGARGPEVLVALGKLLLTVLAGCLLMLTLYGTLMRIFGMSPLRYFVVTREASLMGFTTRSSSASLPVVMQAAEDGGASRTVYGFSLPIGVQLNSDGSALSLGVYAVFAANVGGISLSTGEIILLGVIASLAAIGSGTVPGGQLVAMALVFSQAGLPLAALGLIAAVDQPLGMILTGTNVNGDLAGTFIVAKQEGALAEDSPLLSSNPPGKATSPDADTPLVPERGETL